jgi:hypothetical protein
MKNYQAILLVLGGFGLSIGTMLGKVQSLIHFAGVLNEMGFAFMSFMIGIIGLCSINYNKIYKALI